MAKKMSKLKAFKGRSRGQRSRRKVEAIRKMLIAYRDGLVGVNKDGNILFPRLRKVAGARFPA